MNSTPASYCGAEGRAACLLCDALGGDGILVDLVDVNRDEQVDFEYGVLERTNVVYYYEDAWRHLSFC